MFAWSRVEIYELWIDGEWRNTTNDEQYDLWLHEKFACTSRNIFTCWNLLCLNDSHAAISLGWCSAVVVSWSFVFFGLDRHPTKARRVSSDTKLGSFGLEPLHKNSYNARVTSTKTKVFGLDRHPILLCPVRMGLTAWAHFLEKKYQKHSFAKVAPFFAVLDSSHESGPIHNFRF